MRAALLALILAGCATAVPPPTLVSGVKTETVFQSVLEPCVFVDEVPPIPGTWMAQAQNPDQRRAAKAADDKDTLAYIMRADSLLRGCAKPRPEVKK